MRIPWTARRSNLSILKEINPEYLLEDCCWGWSSSTLATWCEKTTHWKDSDVGKYQGQEEKGATGDKMVGWHRRHNRHEFEWAMGDSEGQGSLACSSPRGHKEWHIAEQLHISKVFQETLPWQYLDFRLPISCTVRNKFSLAFGYLVCDFVTTDLGGKYSLYTKKSLKMSMFLPFLVQCCIFHPSMASGYEE